MGLFSKSHYQDTATELAREARDLGERAEEARRDGFGGMGRRLAAESARLQRGAADQHRRAEEAED